MARITKVSGFQPGFIYDVSQKVGPTKTSANALDDVMLTQLLLGLFIGHLSTRNPKSLALPAISGTFDATTGYWIFEFQSRMQVGNISQAVDGWLSPCSTPNGRHSKGEFMIYRLNRAVYEDNPARFATLLLTSPMVPAVLKTLASKT
ncbi:MAG: hypothetical protein KJZ83_05700 [Burkholderiaceae bacterium]|nr:hypothetical protein [Burkholderiaceae bacterium]